MTTLTHIFAFLVLLVSNAMAAEDPTVCRRDYQAIVESLGVGPQLSDSTQISPTLMARMSTFTGNFVDPNDRVNGGMNYVFHLRDGDEEIALRVPMSQVSDYIDIARWEYDLRRRLADTWSKSGRTGEPPILTPTGFDPETGASRNPWRPDTIDNRLSDSRLMGPQAPDKMLYSLWRQVGNAVGFLHDSEVVHRDIKAKNLHLVITYRDPRTGEIFTSDGKDREVQDVRVVLGDFDLSSQSGRLHPLVLGSVSGTATYAPAEQILGQAPSAQHDVFAMRKMFAEMAAGSLISSPVFETHTYSRGYPAFAMREFRHSLEDLIGPYKALVVHHPSQSLSELSALTTLAEHHETGNADTPTFIKEYARQFLIPLMERDPQRAAETIFTSRVLTDAFLRNLGPAAENGLGLSAEKSESLVKSLSERYGGLPKREAHTVSLNVPVKSEIQYGEGNPYVDWDSAHTAVQRLAMADDLTFVEPKDLGLLPIVNGYEAPLPEAGYDDATRIRPAQPFGTP